MNTGQGAQAIIFLIEEDDETRPLLKENLHRYGYRVIIAIDEEDALERVKGGHLQTDLLLINLVDKSPEETLRVGRRVREQANNDGHIPLVVMAEKYGDELEGTNLNVSGDDWITYLEDAEQLERLLARLLNK
ncbi:MAG: hypothetical protein JO360_18210 [Acidobacteria bacterium]|nr:hypothetical protein [Acidobacteriota bacterium]